ncbi:transposase [Streptomyces sp. NRRL B-24720]
MPGLGPALGVEVVARTGGDIRVFGSSDRLAGIVGFALVPRD